jgi:hypothetical protein
MVRDRLLLDFGYLFIEALVLPAGSKETKTKERATQD